ncbi:HNH endonuclease [Paraburkholderia mimosarum]|uniref:HNH endonuclease n=1 Tax=Paraburkholderia mimosarum TaxID=312026 RepID=UPI0039C22468
MGEITRDKIDAAYEVARQVFEEALGRGEGVAILANEHGLNPNSARGYIRCYAHLRKGERYTRTLSTPAADVFLDRMYEDDGPDALEQGIASIWKHLAYYEATSNSTAHALRAVVARHEQRLAQSGKVDALEAVQTQFSRDVAAALSRTPEARHARLAQAEKMPSVATVTTRVFQRNADVVAEVLYRADGVCQICGKPAPFTRKDGSPFLEVHHRVQLAHGGEDTVENAIATCPNCHREAHFGASKSVD